MSDLTSAPVPAAGDDDHVRGDGPEVIAYLDLGCPHCAAVWPRLRRLESRLCFRHFPIASKHPRAPALHAAVEAAAAIGGEDAFWAMVDSIYADHAHVDDPHLWERVRALGLNLDGFQRERRSDVLAGRVRRDFESGIRAGITGTPALFLNGRPAREEELLTTGEASGAGGGVAN